MLDHDLSLSFLSLPPSFEHTLPLCGCFVHACSDHQVSSENSQLTYLSLKQHACDLVIKRVKITKW